MPWMGVEEFLVSLGRQWHIAPMAFPIMSASGLPLGFSDRPIRCGGVRVFEPSFIFCVRSDSRCLIADV